MTQEELNDLLWATMPEWRKRQLIAEREEADGAEVERKAETEPRPAEEPASPLCK